jgi:hypothetical protein
VPPWMPPQDAGWMFPPRFAADPCPQESYQSETGFIDHAGVREYAVTWGVCVALRTLHATALLNGQPVQGTTEIWFQAADYRSEIIEPVDPFGKLDVKVMRTRYDILKYHPDGIWPNHKGFQELGFLDMTKDQERTLPVTSHSLRGGAYFAGLPFTPVQFPPDVYLRAAGIPPDQHAGSTSTGGAYELALIDGTMALLLNSPPTALQGTELVDYPLTWSYTLKENSQFDIDIPGSELEGDIRVDGLPLPDRRAGPDYELNFTPSGEDDVVAVTHHEGGLSGFHSLVPKGKYGITLSFDSIPDPHFPAQVWNKAVAQAVDLTQNAAIQKDFVTVPIEGGIVIDGKSPQVNPGYNWVLYMYGYGSATEPWFFAYYKVPLDSGSFTLRAFPGVYYVAIQLGDDLAPDMVDGWHRVARQTEIFGPSNLPIVIDTSMFTGKLIIDGKPPQAGLEAGTVTLRQADQTFSRRIFPAQDGEFKLRVPKGAYEVFFTINRETYPQHASGRERMIARLELFDDQNADLVYDTVPVVGPLRVDGKVVDDNLPGDDVRIHFRRRNDSTRWTWGFPGGAPQYYMRIPQGLYEMDFEILRDAMPHVAHGEAPLGYWLPAFSPYVPPSPAR